MKNKFSVQVVLATVLLSSISAYSSVADSKKVKQNPNMSQTTTLASAWTLPNSKSKNITVLQPGRTLPIKFTLIEGGSPLQDTNMVSLSYVKLGCEIGAQPNLTTSVVIVPGTPLASVSASPIESPSPTTSPSPSASSSSSDDEKKVGLKNEKGIFQFNWKVPKSLTTGCYKLIAQKGTSTTTIVQSPVLRVKASR